MAYATFANVLTGFPPLTTIVGTGTNQVTTPDVSSFYIANAEGFVNAYVGAKYATPLTMPEPLITGITSDIAIYKLCEDKLPRIPDYMERRYSNALKTLEAIRDGNMVLPSSQAAVSGGDQFAWSSVGSHHPVFSAVLKDIDQKVDIDFVREERSIRESDF